MNRNDVLYIAHIWSHMCLLGPLAQGNVESDQLLVGCVLQIDKKNQDINKCLKKDFTARNS